MAYSKLDKLPAELLRKIAVGLPSSAALSLMSTCRYIYMICNDWTVWREVVAAQSTLGDSALAILSSLTKPDWKRYMVADALASKGTPMNQYDVERWLPHMMVLHHSAALAKETAMLLPLCDVICNTTIGFGLDSEQPWQDLETCVANVPLPWDLQTWKFAQAASFCLTSQLLARTTLGQLERLLNVFALSSGFVSPIIRATTSGLKTTLSNTWLCFTPLQIELLVSCMKSFSGPFSTMQHTAEARLGSWLCRLSRLFQFLMENGWAK